MGINARASLDPRWTAHHVPVVRGFMKARIKVTRRDPDTEPVYDQNTRTWSDDGMTTVYTGYARVQPYGIIGDVIDAQDTTGRRLMRVQIESKSSGIQLDDMINIIDCPDDQELQHFALEVRGTIGSSNSWVTDLVCEANLKWVPATNAPGPNLTSVNNFTSNDNLTQG